MFRAVSVHFNLTIYIYINFLNLRGEYDPPPNYVYKTPEKKKENKKNYS